MTFVSFGKIAPVTAGTPVQVTTNTNLKVRQLFVTQIAGTTGLTYFGGVNMVKATFVNVLKQFLPPGASGFADTLTIDCGDSNQLTPADFWVDAAVNGEGLIISGLIG